MELSSQSPAVQLSLPYQGTRVITPLLGSLVVTDDSQHERKLCTRATSGNRLLRRVNIQPLQDGPCFHLQGGDVMSCFFFVFSKELELLPHRTGFEFQIIPLILQMQQVI